MKQVTQYTTAEARDFFERLSTYSAEYVRVAIPKIHAHWPSSNYYDEWRYDHPIGHVLHYTAGTSFAGTVRHFVTQHRASSHWVIGKALDRRFEQLRLNLDLDLALRSECVQIVPPDRPAWHAGWVNRILAGTELRNAGILRPVPKGKPVHPGRISRGDFFSCGKYEVEDLDFYWWPGGWSTPFRGEVLRVKTPGGVSFWETFSRGQLSTLVTVLRYLNSLYPEKLDPVWTLAHHNLDPGKNDVVLPLPLNEIRESVLFSNEHVDELDWLAEYDDFEDDFEDLDDPLLLRESDDRQRDRAEEDLDDFDPGDIRGKVDTPEETKEALRRFAFWTEEPQDVVRSVRIFQRGRRLRVDGDAGPETNGRLERELKEWRIR